MTDTLQGRTLADTQELARQAVMGRLSWLAAGTSHKQAIDAAWEGIVEALLTSEEELSRNDLLHAGWESARTEMRTVGQGLGLTQNGKPNTGFQRYWIGSARQVTSFEDDIVDRLAFHQIWQTMTPEHKAVLRAKASIPNDNQAAARSLGLTENAFEGRLNRARMAFKRLWFEGETVPPRRPLPRLRYRWAPDPRRSEAA